MNDDMVWDAIRTWLAESDTRKLVLTHGGDGGSWYCLLDDDADDSFDGVGLSAIGAITTALETKGAARE